jgi:hypothetical protein
MATQSDWPLLSQAFDRLSTYEALPQFSAYDVMRAARDIVGRAQICLTGTRSDITATQTPEPIEGLLAKAARADVFSYNNEIFADYDGRQDFRSILGPRSNLQSENTLAWSYGLTDCRIRFRNVRVHWPSLVGVLTQAGFTVSAEQSHRRGAYKGELTAFMARLAPMMLSSLTDDDIARRFVDHVEAKTKRGQSVLKLPQLRHIANQVAKIRAH